MKYVHLAATVTLLLAGCAPNTPQQPIATTNGDIVFQIRDYDAAPLAGTPTGKTESFQTTCEILSKTWTSSGKLEFLLKLDPDVIQVNNQTRTVHFRNATGSNTVRMIDKRITRKIAADIPFESMRAIVNIPSSGPEKGTAVGFELIEPPPSQMIRGERLAPIALPSSRGTKLPRYRITYKIPKHPTPFEITVIAGSSDDMETFNQRNQLGDIAFIGLYPTPEGWSYFPVGLGPEASDYSFLETQSKREDFD